MDAIFDFSSKYDVIANANLDNLANIRVINVSGGSSGSEIPEIKSTGSFEFVNAFIVPAPVPLIDTDTAVFSDSDVTFLAQKDHVYFVSAHCCGSQAYTWGETVIQYSSSAFDTLYTFHMDVVCGPKACIIKANSNAEVLIKCRQNSWWGGRVRVAFDITNIPIDIEGITVTSGGDNTTRVYFNTIPVGQTNLYFAAGTGRQRGYTGVADVSTSNLLYYYDIPSYDTNEGCTMVLTGNNSGNIYTNTYDGAEAKIYTIPTLL